ncbi:hypothetical protein LCGC14_2774580 [marine sediment metagenome]|uniref:Uncharacterized protein n=1 Tax=marine sediment metagenome TaxID=412755 RepID=A0A0F9B3T5_9ZZZZ
MFIRIYDKDRENYLGIRKEGNWNMGKVNWKEGPRTKPIGFMRFKLDEKDVELCWKHDEILDLIKHFHDIDVESIKMIINQDINTGDIENYESPFIEKIQKLLDELKKDIAFLKENGS